MYSDLSTPDLEDRSIKWQMARLVEYFNILPVTVFSIDSIEADDAIATLTTDVFNKEYQKVNIMSADKDFLQLVNEKVSVWSPTKKRLYGPKEVMDDYGISSKNFIYYRMLDGDDSDNIDGIKGAGLKTIIKAYPFLKEETEANLEQILSYADDNRNKLKIHESVCGGQQLLHRNYELMQLKNVNIADSNKLRIKELTDVPTTKLNKLQFIKMFNEDKAYSVMPDYNTWLNQTFQTLNYYT
jgi:DNA polymerase-1